jgi:glycosyltransferase involved in cell wall biosynthesis
MYFPFKKVDGMMAKVSVLFLFPLWAVWVGWRNRVDLIIAFGPLYAFIQALSKIILKRPMVTLIRLSSSISSTTKKRLGEIFYFYKVFQYLGLIFSDRIITNHSINQDDILKRLENRKYIDIDILYNNIPSIRVSSTEDILQIKNNYGIPKEAKIIVTAGIINRRKNVGILIECLPEVRIKNLYLIIAGDGSTKTDFQYRDSLKRLAKKLGIDHRVIFTGWVGKEELWKIYQASDLFVLPSLNEGMPNALLEALGSGVSCMGTDIPGIRDILQYDELIFDPMGKKSFVNKIELFFSYHHFSDRVKRLCQERTKDFFFDWKEELFQIVTQGTFHRGGGCQSK